MHLVYIFPVIFGEKYVYTKKARCRFDVDLIWDNECKIIVQNKLGINLCCEICPTCLLRAFLYGYFFTNPFEMF